MKNLIFTLIFLLVFSTVLMSCRETSQKKDVTQDVLEDLNDVMQPAEDEVKELVHKDSITSKERKDREKDSIH